MFRKILAVISAAVVMFTCGIVTAAAESNSLFEYEVNGGEVTITKYIGSGKTTLHIPPKIDNMKVTAIGEYAFKDNAELQTVVIPTSVSNVGEGAFYNCTGLKSLYVPGSIKETPTKFCYNCFYLETVVLSSGLTALGNASFVHCRKLTQIKLPDTLKTIGGSAFLECNLSSIELPDGLEEIGSFGLCSGGNLKSVTIPASVKTLGKYAVGYYGVGYVEDDFTINCYTGTEAHRYAVANGINYELLDSDGIKSGDVNGDGNIDMKDITDLQRYVNGWKVAIVPTGADVDVSGEINMKDITTLQKLINSK